MRVIGEGILICVILGLIGLLFWLLPRVSARSRARERRQRAGVEKGARWQATYWTIDSRVVVGVERLSRSGESLERVGMKELTHDSEGFDVGFFSAMQHAREHAAALNAELPE